MLGPFSALKVYLLEYIYLNNANVPFVLLLTVALLNCAVEYLFEYLQTGSNYAPHNTCVSIILFKLSLRHGKIMSAEIAD